MMKTKSSPTTSPSMEKGNGGKLPRRQVLQYVRFHIDLVVEGFGEKARHSLNRYSKSCRLRWLNYLRPGIRRGAISPDEEDLIIRLHRLLGNRWALIAARLSGRTDNEIKNYWNTYLVRRFQAARPDNKHLLNYEEKNETFASNQRVLNAQVNSRDKVLASSEFSASKEQDKDLVNMISNGAKNSDANNLIPFRADNRDDSDMNFLNAGDEDFVFGVPESNLASHDEKIEMGEQNDLRGVNYEWIRPLEACASSCSIDENKVETQTTNIHDSGDPPTLSMELKKLALFLELED